MEAPSRHFSAVHTANGGVFTDVSRIFLAQLLFVLTLLLHSAQILGGKTVTPSEAASQKAWLDRSLHAFYIEQCLPQFDALSKEQAATLERLGVPGLAYVNEGATGDAAKEARSKAQAKRARIMSVLDGVLAEN